MNWRRHVSIAITMVLLASACAGDSREEPGAAGGEGGGEPLPLDQQVLTIGTLADNYNIEPGRVDLGKFTLNTGVFDALVRLNEDLHAEAVLAERWELTPESNTFRFFLRRGVKFHDGSEFGAEDVKYTWDLIVASNPANSQGLGPESVKVVDPYTLDVTTIRPNKRLVEDIAHPTWAINRRGSDPLNPVGTGPFRFAEYVRNDRFVVERFEDYWDKARLAKVKRITFKFIPDAQTKLLALRSGELDLIMDVPRDLADGLRGVPGVKTVNSKVGAYNALNFAPNAPEPYVVGRDKAVREAVAFAIDRKALLDRVWAGNAEPSRTWIPASVLGRYESMVGEPVHDPRRAAQVLDAAGWVPGSDGIRVKDGKRLSLAHVVAGPGDSDPRDSAAAAEFIQSQLKSIGIETKIEVPEATAGLARANSGTYDILHYIANQNSANPCLLPDLFFYSKGGARARFSGPGGQTDVALEACRAASDVEAVRRSAAEAVQQLVNVDYVVIPLMGIYRIWAMRDKVAGFVAHPSLTNQRWEAVYLTK